MRPGTTPGDPESTEQGPVDTTSAALTGQEGNPSVARVAFGAYGRLTGGNLGGPPFPERPSIH